VTTQVVQIYCFLMTSSDPGPQHQDAIFVSFFKHCTRLFHLNYVIASSRNVLQTTFPHSSAAFGEKVQMKFFWRTIWVWQASTSSLPRCDKQLHTSPTKKLKIDESFPFRRDYLLLTSFHQITASATFPNSLCKNYRFILKRGLFTCTLICRFLLKVLKCSCMPTNCWGICLTAWLISKWPVSCLANKLMAHEVWLTVTWGVCCIHWQAQATGACCTSGVNKL